MYWTHSPVRMRFEEVLEDVGGFSKFQFLVLHLLCLPQVILPLHFLLHNFISATPPHHCTLGDEKSGTLADPETQALRVPREDDGSFSSCRVYAAPPTLDLSQVNQTNVSTVVPCPGGWVYDRSQFSSTTAMQWDLVCDDKKLNQALATFFFGGVTLGAIVFGQLSDKPVALTSIVMKVFERLVCDHLSSVEMDSCQFAYRANRYKWSPTDEALKSEMFELEPKRQSQDTK